MFPPSQREPRQLFALFFFFSLSGVEFAWVSAEEGFTRLSGPKQSRRGKVFLLVFCHLMFFAFSSNNLCGKDYAVRNWGIKKSPTFFIKKKVPISTVKFLAVYQVSAFYLLPAVLLICIMGCPSEKNKVVLWVLTNILKSPQKKICTTNSSCGKAALFLVE